MSRPRRSGRTSAATRACPSSAATSRRATRRRAPSRSGRIRPQPGRTPESPGNCTVVASASVSSATSVGTRQLACEHEQIIERPAVARRGRAVETAHERERLRDRGAEVVAELHPGPSGDELGRELDAVVRVDAPLLGRHERGALPRREPRGVREQVPERRARRTAGSSRSTVPSSTATSTASPVRSFVTDAHSSIASRGPCTPSSPSAPTTPAAAVPAPQESMAASASTGRY